VSGSALGRSSPVTFTELIAVRHGESEGNVAREAALAEQAEVITIDLRDPDVPLSHRGQAQADAVGHWLARAVRPAATAVWSSPYLRARQTAARALAAADLALPVRVDERLRDRELGVLDLLTGLGVRTRFPAEAERRRWLGKLYYRPPGGESWADVALRLRSYVADLERSTTAPTVIVFAHDALIMLLRYVLEDLTEEQLLELARTETVANASVTRLVRPEEGTAWRLAEFNTQSHLQGTAEPTTHEGNRDVHPH
jgi:broad specificity phosphatase PhoE